MSRLPTLPADQLNARQKKLFDEITGGKRGVGRPIEAFLMPDGGMRGPFGAMLHHPEIGSVIQHLGGNLRFEGTLSGIHRELAIITVGRDWQAQYEWWAHANIGEKEGLDPAVIQAVYDKAPLPTEDASLIAVHGFVKELLETRHVSDAAYAAAMDVVGQTGVIELVMLTGYYCLISATLNAFEVGMPEGIAPPFDK